MRLVEVAQLTKKIVLIVATLMTLYLIFLVSKEPTRNLYLTIFPPKNLPTIGFGYLDPLEFTAAPTLNSTPQYVLNTRTGQLPTNIPNVVKVYKFILPRLSFGAGEKAQKDALFLGFGEENRTSPLNATTFEWQDVQFGGSLKIDLTTNTMQLVTPLTGKGSFFPAGKFMNKESVIEKAKEVFKQIGRFQDFLYTNPDRGSQTVAYGKFKSNGVVKADSPLEAQLARVDFFRKIVDYPILGPDPKKGLLRIFIRAYDDKPQFPQLSFPLIESYYWEINTDEKEVATYPAIPISAAWDQIAQNKGVIANVTPSGASPFVDSPPVKIQKILINDVYMAYYDNTKPQKFLQPIYVFQGNFTGDNGITGDISLYYPAISGQYVKTSGAAQGQGQTTKNK
ncbi:hypothetical protein HYV31_03900 [candidate division WWE3 bacterium]|nr:hypothetical protein [candidate division WWE3 bacterium]